MPSVRICCSGQRLKMSVLLTVRIVAGPAHPENMLCVFNRKSLKTKCRMCWQCRDDRRAVKFGAREQTTAAFLSNDSVGL